MKKLNSVVYNKILVQAEEAKQQGFNKLANIVLDSIGSTPRDDNEIVTYSSSELESNVYKQLWKTAMEVIKYHELESVDIQKINDVVQDLTNTVLGNLESNLDVQNKIGSLEPELPGETTIKINKQGITIFSDESIHIKGDILFGNNVSMNNRTKTGI